MASTSTPDFIVIGSGSAGAVIAARLSEDPNAKVLVLEAGRRENDIRLSMPILFPFVMADPKFNWSYMGEPEPFADNRQIRQPRGKALGGSSMINGMLYARGHARDYDEWRQLGNEGWSYDDVLPYFKKSENHWGPEDAWHGKGGPLSVKQQPKTNDLYQRFIATVKSLGYEERDSFHRAKQEGWGPPPLNIHEGTRASTAARFLIPAMSRPNLTVETGALVTRIEVENGRAVAVHYRDREGRDQRVTASQEIILSGGAYNSPQVLLLSGIGPAEQLGEHGIDVVHHLPGVGMNLQDHPSVAMVNAAARSVTLTNSLRIDRAALAGLQWLLTRGGMIADMPVTANGFIKTRPELERPDAQCLFQPTMIGAQTWFPGWRKPKADVVAMACVLLRPEGRGWVKLRSADPTDKPRILSNVLSTENDRAFFRRLIPQLREIFGTAPLSEVLRGEVMPGPNVKTDAEIDAWVRSAINTALHPVGTCAMGQDDMAVVDARLRVHGLTGLRVADAAIMPRIVGGNTNAASIMIGEKAADMIKADNGLVRS
ncbi:MAG: choline dehydrogenase [Alphaproteobacteria bacterium]|nr:choline dehydrogenase [Alphaproteobacteria bacterium]MBU0792463.1 choline dehydrogenase [Alphaproteobacteria bacterium]MBU0876342.1 choline dehydrogenase [Alphaproteobacteria bacterium]MBU1768267.1 choline dehydrogenase [Alphaproteobacteria bacterium]